MRQRQQSSSQSSGTASIVVLLLALMSLMIAYLAVYSDMLKERKTLRVYVAESLDIPTDFSRKR